MGLKSTPHGALQSTGLPVKIEEHLVLLGLDFLALLIEGQHEFQVLDDLFILDNNVSLFLKLLRALLFQRLVFVGKHFVFGHAEADILGRNLLLALNFLEIPPRLPPLWTLLDGLQCAACVFGLHDEGVVGLVEDFAVKFPVLILRVLVVERYSALQVLCSLFPTLGLLRAGFQGRRRNSLELRNSGRVL